METNRTYVPIDHHTMPHRPDKMSFTTNLLSIIISERISLSCQKLNYQNNNKRNNNKPANDPHKINMFKRCWPNSALLVILPIFLPIILGIIALPALASQASIKVHNSGYTGILLTFSNQLDVNDFVKEDLIENVQRFIQDSSTFINEALNGRVFFSDVQILIPYRWNSPNNDWLPKPGQSVMKDRRTLYKDADILVGFDDPIFGQMPVTIQHDGCAQYGHKIHLPANYTSDRGNNDKVRAFIREWASFRYGIFKENGYRNDPMYPPFYSVPVGLARQQSTLKNVQSTSCEDNITSTNFQQQQLPLWGLDSQGQRCTPESDLSSGLPLASSFDCLPYPSTLTSNGSADTTSSSNSIMYGDWSYDSNDGSPPASKSQPSGSASGWHFCGDNFEPRQQQYNMLNDHQQSNQNDQLQTMGTSGRLPMLSTMKQHPHRIHHYHDIYAPNKQNIMCQRRSAMDVIRQSADFEPDKFRENAFNRLPATNFQFIQEEPPRFIIGVEYTQTLLANSRRMDSELLDAAIKKFISFDLITNSEVAMVWFGSKESQWRQFKKLNNSIDSRLKLYSPSFAAFSEPPLSSSVTGSQEEEQSQCSFALIVDKAQLLWSNQIQNKFDDMDCDLVIITSGNFIEDKAKIEEIYKTLRTERFGLHLIIYPFQMATNEHQHKMYVEKLAHIQKLFDAKIHIIKEHRDANNNVKMTTLLQFFEIFEYMGKGHSWDQHDSYITMKNQNVNGTDLRFYFDVDSTIENELIVGFIETKKLGITNLQLRSPSGQLTLNDRTPAHSDSLFEYRQQLKIAGFHLRQQHIESGTWLLSASSDVPIQTAATAIAKVNSYGNTSMGNCWIQTQYETIQEHQVDQPGSVKQSKPTTTLLKSIKVFAQTGADHSMPYLQDITARMEIHDDSGQIVQNVDMLDDGLGVPDMTKGDGIHSQYVVRAQKNGYYKVFVELNGNMGPAGSAPGSASMDGQLSSNQDYPTDQALPNEYDVIANYPDHHRQPFTNGTRSISSRVSINNHGQDIWHQSSPLAPTESLKIQKPNQYLGTPCCGSFLPSIQQQEPPTTRYLSRQLYCGTFYTDEGNKLAEQKPARVNNLRIVKVDRSERKVTVQWVEPTIDMSSYLIAPSSTASPASSSETTNNTESLSDLSMSRGANRMVSTPRSKSSGVQTKLGASHRSVSSVNNNDTDNYYKSEAYSDDVNEPSPKARYEIKSFTDINSLDGEFYYNNWDVDGTFPNASSYGGTKTVVLRVPHNKGGIYYVAMRTYNILGIASEYSNIVRFDLRNIRPDSDDLHNQLGSNSIDGYNDPSSLDDNGPGSTRHGGANILESLVVLTTISVAAFMFAASCVAMGFCLYNSNRNKSSIMSNNSDDTKAVAVNGNSSSASSASGCNSDIASSAASSQSGQDIEISKISLTHNNNISSSIKNANSSSLHNPQQFKNAVSDVSTLNINMPYLQHHPNAMPSPVMSTITINHQNDHLHHLHHHHHHHHNLLGTLSKLGSSVQDDANGLILTRSISQEKLSNNMNGSRDYATPSIVTDSHHHQPTSGLVTAISPVQSWPADILLSHYDKVKQAKERNEIPPVMRIENLDDPSMRPPSFGLLDSTNQKHQISNSTIDNDDNYAIANSTTASTTNHHFDRQSYINQQLQQQLNNVILNGPNNILRPNSHLHQSSPHTVDRSSTGSRSVVYNNGLDRLEDFMQQGPPQYVYYNQNHFDNSQSTPASQQQQQQQQMDNHPSLVYGQTIANNVQNSSYYANQQQSPWTALDQHHQQQQQHHEQANDIDSTYQQTTIDGYASVKKPNSAVSQV